MASEAPQPVALSGASIPDAPPRPKRSWRRKFRKMRIRFDDAMSQSNALIMDEWKAMGTARRLQAENDQLLDALLDFNDQPRVAARARFLLDRDLDRGLAADVPLIKTLAALEASVPHTTPADCPPATRPSAIDLSEHAPGYLAPQHEDDYLLALDALLDDAASDPRHPPAHLGPPYPPLSEKDLTIRNPDSVYNWLRKNQPQVFLQDKDAPHDNASEKAVVKPKKSRPSAVGTPGPDHDDDAPDKARKKPDPDDTAYRPKGGSSRPSKRKREGEGDKARKKRAAATTTAATAAATTTAATATTATTAATATAATAPPA